MGCNRRTRRTRGCDRQTVQPGVDEPNEEPDGRRVFELDETFESDEEPDGANPLRQLGFRFCKLGFQTRLKNQKKYKKQRKMGHVSIVGPSMDIVEAKLKSMLNEEILDSQAAACSHATCWDHYGF
ncbi:unnamed protein product [Camellia sinensis]